MPGAVIDTADSAIVKRLNELEVERVEAEIARIRNTPTDDTSYRLANYAKSFMFVAVGVAALVVAL